MDIRKYSVVWDTPSKNSAGSMPCGGHDIGLNVWTEDGDILFYIDRSGSFDENGQMLKLGRARIRCTPNPFADGQFLSQTLDLADGRVIIEGRLPDGSTARASVWVSVDSPRVYITLEGGTAFSAEAVYESWRFAPRVIERGHRMPTYGYKGYPGEVVTSADTVTQENGRVFFSHSNGHDGYFQKAVKLEGLGEYADQLWDPQRDRVFGGVMLGDGFVCGGSSEGTYAGIPFRGLSLKSTAPRTAHTITLVFHSDAYPSVDAWKQELQKEADKALAEMAQKNAAALDYWHRYWENSYICINEGRDESDRPYRIGKNYQLFRYMLGCNPHGSAPTKFNGGLFISDAVYTVDPSFAGETPDYRCWGGSSFTAQNQRLVYWPMLKSGDFDLMLPQFDFYLKALQNAMRRTQVYWSHGGCSFTEQVENSGLPAAFEWGWDGCCEMEAFFTRLLAHDATELIGPWTKYLYTGQLEFSFMILLYKQYSGRDIAKYMPFVKESIRFFNEHYRFMHRINAGSDLDENGKLVFFPSTACETYKDATNPTDLLSGLHAAIRALMTIGEEYLSDEEKRYFQEMYDRLPEISVEERNGHRMLAPAKSWSAVINSELPQLYPVFPYGLYGIGHKDLDLAVNAWRYGDVKADQKNYVSWHQDNIFCARMGLTEEAAEITAKKLDDSDRRFTAFWGPGHDWAPDHNWGGSGMIGLQEMLVQVNHDTVYLFPAWPKDWDVSFKLHLPDQNTIECELKDGVVCSLTLGREQKVVNCLEA